MFKGSLTALITPMNRDGSLDYTALEDLIDWQIVSGTQALVSVGTTGESPTLTHDEHRKIIEKTVEIAKDRVPVIAGAGSNSTVEALEMVRHAKISGAKAALVVTPYYNKPTQEGLYRHYMTLADSVELPIIIYNIPGRSVVDMATDTIVRLALHKNIIGIKDATANLARPLQLRHALGARDFCQLSGEDATAVSFLAAGGDGCISVTANVAPRFCADIQILWHAQKEKQAIALQQKLFPLHEALFIETSPAPVKYAASLLGFGSSVCRLPIAPLLAESQQRVKHAVELAGITRE